VIDRALGALASSTFVGRFGAALINQTASAITNFTLNYVGEQWRTASTTPNTLSFEYGLGVTDLLNAGAGAFTAFTGLDFTSPVNSATAASLNGNATANRTSKTGTVTGINWLPGQSLVLRWSDTDDIGTDQMIGIDDVVFSSVINAPPTSLTLSKSDVNENVATNNVIGNLTTVDPNAGDTFTYSLVTGVGATDNASFNILNNQLRTTAALNFELKNAYSIRVETRDQAGATFSRTFAITVNDVNEAPAASTTGPYVGLAGATIALQGTASDPDAGQSLTYEWDLNYNGVTFVGTTSGANALATYTSTGTRTVALRVTDDGAPALSTIATTTVNVSSSVVGRFIYYRGSTFDNAADSQAAIDPSKTPLISGASSRSNVSNYVRGLNGIIVDIAGANTNSIGIADFQFFTGNVNSTSNWATLPSSALLENNPIVVLASPAGPGIVRIKLNFTDNAIAKAWLQVRVLANARTGLSSDDTFAFGSAPGDVFIDRHGQRNNARDLNAIRYAISSRLVGIDQQQDINKDGVVSRLDYNDAKQFLAAQLGLRWITLAPPIGLRMSSSNRPIRKLDLATGLDSTSSIDSAISQLAFS